MDVLPALLGVGYICGARVSSYIFAGGVIGWFVLMPLIALFGADLTIFPASVPVSELGASNLVKLYPLHWSRSSCSRRNHQPGKESATYRKDLPSGIKELRKQRKW